MAEGFWVKVASNQAYKPVTGFWVKVSPTSWVSVSDAWVKVDANQAYKPFYSAGTSPVSPLEILADTDSSDRLRLQGVNKRWSPTPTTLQYKFVYVDPTTNSESDITSFTTTTNPSSGTTTTLPSASTYVTIANGALDPYWYPGQDNVYKFRVRGTSAAGFFYTYEAEYHMYVPKAPTLTISNKTTTSLTLNITAASNDDYLATNRYIVYAYDGTAYRYAGSAGGITGLGGYSVTSDPRTVNIGGLVLGKTYTFYVIPTTGFAGSTPSNATGYQGLEASIDTTSTGPQPPTSFTATTTLTDKVRLTWSGASGDISSFGIYWSTGELGPGDQDGDLNDETVTPDFTATVDNTKVFSTYGYYDDTGISAGTSRYYWIRSQGSSGDGLWTPVSGGVKGTRVDAKPVNSVAPTITGTIKEGESVTLNAGTWSNSPTSYKYEVGYETYDPLLGELIFNTVQTYSNVTSNTQSYTIPLTWKSSYGNDTEIKVLVTATNAAGSNSAYSTGYAVTAGLQTYTFAFGDKIYISTNGYIAFDSGYSDDAVTSTSGKVLAIIPRDLQQNGNVYYWSNGTEFRIKWVGYNYGQTSQVQKYEVTFYDGESYADVYAETVNTAAGTTGAYYNNGTAVTNYSAALTTGQSRRVYFNATDPTTVTYTAKSTTLMKSDIALTSGTTDKGYTEITTAKNQTSFTNGTVKITGGSTETADGFVTRGATLTVSTADWPTGTTFTYQWYRTRDIDGLTPTATTTGTTQTSTIIGEQLYCKVSYSNTTYGVSGSVNTYSYRIVPPAPAYTLTDNTDGTFKISSVSATGSDAYHGTWKEGTTGTDTAIASASSPTANTTDTNITTTASVGTNKTAYVSLYSSAKVTYEQVLEVRYSSWEKTDKNVTVTKKAPPQSTGQMRRVTLPNSFTNTSTTVYVSTNGYISLGTDPGTSISFPSTGVQLAPFRSDLVQSSLTYKADSSNFWIKWSGYRLGDVTKTCSYLIKLYWNSTTADVYFIDNKLTDADATAIQSGGSANTLWSASTDISSTNPITEPSGMTSSTTQNGQDDARTALTATKPVASSPTASSIGYVPLGNLGTQYTPSSAANTSVGYAGFTGSQDDGYWTFNLPFTVRYNGSDYTTIYVGTNSYITFGSGSTAYSSLSATNPASNKVLVYAADRSSNSVYWYYNESVFSNSTVFNIKLNCGTTSSTPGTGIQWEIYGNKSNNPISTTSNPGTKSIDVTIVAGSGGTTGAYTTDTSISSLGGNGTAWRITSQ